MLLLFNIAEAVEKAAAILFRIVTSGKTACTYKAGLEAKTFTMEKSFCWAAVIFLLRITQRLRLHRILKALCWVIRIATITIFVIETAFSKKPYTEHGTRAYTAKKRFRNETAHPKRLIFCRFLNFPVRCLVCRSLLLMIFYITHTGRRTTGDPKIYARFGYARNIRASCVPVRAWG